MNNLQINARLTSCPTLQYTPQGKAILKLNLCHNYWHGVGKDTTPIFLDATFWEKGAETVNQKGLSKGQEIMISGQFLPETYEGKNGTQTKYTLQYPQFICIIASPKPKDASEPELQSTKPEPDNPDMPF
jgi:single-stranded DNA-binding protein